MDLLPGGVGATPTMFLSLSPDVAAFSSASITLYQRKFIERRSDLFKDTVRLTKHWRDMGIAGNFLTRESAPKSYLLELICAAALEKEPSLRSCFMFVLRMLVSIAKEKQFFYWTENYTKEDIEKAVAQKRIMRCGIIDPANPTNNLWATLADPASLCSYAQQTLAAIEK